MGWIVRKRVEIGRGKTSRIWGGAFLCWILFMLATPRIPISHQHHHFADMRNFLGVPNTWNVFTNFPFLIVGVVGFVLSLQGCYFNISLRGEIWGWVLFYGGIVAVAFGSAYYHLKPDESRVMWDTLPFCCGESGATSWIKLFVWAAICCFTQHNLCKVVFQYLHLNMYSFVLIDWCPCVSGILKFAAENGLLVVCRIFNDLRLCMMFQLIPCVAIPIMAFLYPPKYTHSVYWIWAAGACLIAKFEAALDRKIYHANWYFISGHSLEHLCLAAIPVLSTIMLMYRNVRMQRLGDLKERL